MRNLRNTARTAVQFSEVDTPLTATTWDTTNDSLVCAFGPSPSQASIELRRTGSFGSDNGATSTSIAVWDAQCPNPDLECDEILDLHYFPDTAIICLILRGGDIVLVREQPLPGEELLEIVGSVDAGIVSASWSPDDEMVILVTGEGNVLFMSREFETISEVKMESSDVDLSRGVDVGWGKKETQFLGKRARALKDPTVPDKVDTGKLSATDDAGVRISWRGDGAFVSVNAVVENEEQEGRRLIRVYSREGVLDSVSEAVDNFEGPLSWRPAGNIITGVKRTEEYAEVIFFEKNGLRHGEFGLRMTKDELQEQGSVNQLHWNVDSTVLAVCFKDRVQLWTMGNYHYYLKQEIHLHGSQAEIQGISWHPEKALSVALRGSREVLMLDFAFVVAKGSTCEPNDFGTVAVIDGKTVKLTPLRAANVPPPMALHEIQVEENAIDVAISSSKSSLSVLTSKDVSIFNFAVAAKSATAPTLKCSIPWDPNLGLPLQLAMMNEDLVVLSYRADIDETCLWQSSEASGDWSHLDAGSNHIASIASSVEYNSLCIQTNDRAVMALGLKHDSSPLHTIAKLPKSCPCVEVVTVGDEEIAFGLTVSGSLYANHVLLVSNCTSFLVTSTHLIFTTTHHLLQFVHLTSVEDLEVPPNEPESDERCRSIERGARLVTVMPSASSVVLQMPRGNLETIYPRALVLAAIRKSIEAKRYKKAFLTCRNQRVDMNVLHDHAPEQFMANVPLFLDQLKKVEYIDLFLSQLRDEDVSKTMYKETIRRQPQMNQVNGAVNGISEPAETLLKAKSKTNSICDALLDALQPRKSTNLQNIITANVCKSPPDLEGGLSVVSTLRLEGEVGEKAAEHICFLADINQLYDTALGMYDLETTLLIAQQSQKDPKEYVPYLQSLQEMELHRQHFTIDNDLGRYKKALKSLHDLDAFDELKAYAEKHELYSTAVELYKYNASRLNALMKLYAGYLAERNRFTEAGVAYEFLHDYKKALPMYRQAQRWREALSCATMIPLPDTELADLASGLAEGLIESKEYQNAATIYLEYLNNVPECARLLCKAYLFAEAMRVVGLRRMPELLESMIDAGLIEGFANITELFADFKSQLSAQVPRLRELRVKKEKDPLAFYAGDAVAGETGADIPDDISLAPTDNSTSGGTFMTRYTGRTNGSVNTQTTRRTSKNKRREERKRARGKKGSVYEEEYLVNSIGRLMDRINETGDDVKRLVESLVRRGMRERAVAAEQAMVEVVNMCETVLSEVFEIKEEQNGIDESGHARQANDDVPRGADLVYLDMMNGGGKRTAPVLKKVQRLTLIS